MTLSRTDANPPPPVPCPSPSAVILLTHEFAPFRGGVATFCDGLAQGMAEQGQAPEIWAPDYLQDLPASTGRFTVLRLPGAGNLRPAGLAALGSAVWKNQHLLRGKTLLLPSVGAQMVVMLLSLLPGWPRPRIAVLWHGSELLRFRQNLPWRLLASLFAPKIQRVFAASPYVLSLIQESFLAPKIPAPLLIPCAPGEDAFLPPQSSPPDSQGRIRILTLARIHPRKGQLHTANALAALPPELKNRIVYQIAGEGDGAYLDQVRAVCTTASVAFEYLGPVPGTALSSIYAQCDIYAMTSRSLPRSVEGFGITYLEAGLQGKPVIACRSGGVEGAVLHESSGLLVEENDLPGLTEAFARLIRDPLLRQRLGEGNRTHAAGFSWANSAARLLEALQEKPEK